MSLVNKNIIVGVTGSIAAYKTAELIRALRAQQANVRVVMTPSAKQFISATTLQALSTNTVRDSLWDESAEAAMSHIELARWADIIIVAPATAHVIAKLAHGLADDLLTTLCLASTAKIFLAPAMNQQMWAQAVVHDNVNRAKQLGMLILGPASGSQACGDSGLGRMLEPDDIVCLLAASMLDNAPLKGINVLITAGPTQEPIDPVRYVSNHSSGKMGYALAQQAQAMGADVVLISGPVNLDVPYGVDCIAVLTALQMHAVVMQEAVRADVFIAAAAVADYRLQKPGLQKIKKNAECLQLDLIKNPDCVASVCQLKSRPRVMAFAAETNNVIENAAHKLKAKGCDWIVANDVSRGQVFGDNANEVTVLDRKGIVLQHKATKLEIARALLLLYAKELTMGASA